MDRLLRPGVFAAFAAALACLSYPEVVLGLKAFALRDYGIFGYPLAAYQKEAFWRGELPLWNPLNCAGIPFLAQWNTMVFYPGALIYLLLPMPWSHGIFMLGHQALAAVGMYFFARHLTGSQWGSAAAGVIFGFNGLTMDALMWPNNIAALGLMPWVALAFARLRQPGGCGRIAVAALIGVCQLFTGAPELIGFTWVIALAALCAIANRAALLSSLGKAALALGLTLLAGAIQLLPFLELLEHSQRSSAFGGADWSMPLWGWANLFAPLFRSYRSPQGVFFQTDQEWTSSYYFSALAIMLLPFSTRGSRARWVWVALLAGSFLLALGPAGKVWAALKAALPLLGFIRFPIKFVVPLIFSAALLSAFALAWLERGDPKTSRRIVASGVSVGAVILVAVAWSSMRPIEYEQPRAVLLNGLARLAWLGAFSWALLRIVRGEQRAWLKAAAVGLIAADLITHAPRQNTVADASVYAPGLSREGPLKELSHGSGRAFQTRQAHDRFYFEMRPNPTGDYMGRRLGLYGNCNLLDHIPVVDGFYSLYLPWQRQLWEKIFFAPTNDFPTGLARLLGVAAMSNPSNPVDWVRPAFKPLPLVSAGQEVQRAGTNDILARLEEAAFDPASRLYVTDPGAQEFPAAEVKVEILSVTPHRVEARIESTSASMALLTQSWHPAWRALVNGVEEQIVRADHAFQAVRIPPGQSHLIFEYADRKFKTGIFISAAAIMGCIALLLIAPSRPTA